MILININSYELDSYKKISVINVEIKQEAFARDNVSTRKYQLQYEKHKKSDEFVIVKGT